MAGRIRRADAATLWGAFTRLSAEPARRCLVGAWSFAASPVPSGSSRCCHDNSLRQVPSCAGSHGECPSRSPQVTSPAVGCTDPDRRRPRSTRRSCRHLLPASFGRAALIRSRVVCIPRAGVVRAPLEATLDLRRALVGTAVVRVPHAVVPLIPDSERPLRARRPGRQCAVLNTHDLADRVASEYGEDSASLQRSSVSRLRRSFKEDREFRAIRNHLLPGGSGR